MIPTNELLPNRFTEVRQTVLGFESVKLLGAPGATVIDRIAAFGVTVAKAAHRRHPSASVLKPLPQFNFACSYLQRSSYGHVRVRRL